MKGRPCKQERPFFAGAIDWGNDTCIPERSKTGMMARLRKHRPLQGGSDYSHAATRGQVSHVLKIFQVAAGFRQTETWLRLVAVNALRSHPDHRASGRRPAILAITSISAGQA